jgi:hypothetical protein
MTNKCESSYCEAETTAKFAVSENEPYDETRNYCEACREIYYVGLQHGRYHEAARYGLKPGRESASQPNDKPTFDQVKANRQAFLDTFTIKELEAALKRKRK